LVMIADVYHRIPCKLGGGLCLCKRCGQIVDAFPDMSRSAVLRKKQEGDASVCKHWNACGSIFDIQVDWRPFPSRRIFQQTTAGLSVDVQCGFIPKDPLEKSLECTCPAAGIEQFTCSSPSAGLMDGAVVKDPESVPSHIPVHEAKLLFKSEVTLQEDLLNPDEQLSSSHAFETWKALASREDARRPQNMQVKNLIKQSVPTWSDICKKAQEYKDSLKVSQKKLTSETGPSAPAMIMAGGSSFRDGGGAETGSTEAATAARGARVKRGGRGRGLSGRGAGAGGGRGRGLTVGATPPRRIPSSIPITEAFGGAKRRFQSQQVPVEQTLSSAGVAVDDESSDENEDEEGRQQKAGSGRYTPKSLDKEYTRFMKGKATTCRVNPARALDFLLLSWCSIAYSIHVI
jgi:hypothetical protein